MGDFFLIETLKLTGRIYGSDSWRTWSSVLPPVYPLSGEYFIEFFNAQNQLTGVVRDLLGLMPVYYTLRPSLKIHRTLREAATFLGQPTANWEYIYSVMAGDFTKLSESPFNEVYRLPPGHLLFNKDGKWVTRPFFKALEARPTKDFKKTFLSLMSERAKAYPGFLISFSGGLDSSLLLASLIAQNHNANAATLIFDDPLASEEAGLKAFEERWGKRFERIPAPRVDSGIYNWQQGDLYFYNPTETLFNPIFHRARELNVTDVWVGYGADEVFNLNSGLLKALALSGDWTGFKEAFAQEKLDNKTSIQSAASFIKEMAPRPLKRVLANFWPGGNSPLPQIRKYQKIARANRLKRMRPDPIENELSERFFHSGTVAFAAEQSHELSYPQGIHFSYPYLDLRLIEVSLSFGTKDFYQRGLNKFTLRNQFEEILPREITGRLSRQAYDGWLLRVWEHQSDTLDALSKSALARFQLNSPPQNIYDKLKLLYASQFRLEKP